MILPVNEKNFEIPDGYEQVQARSAPATPPSVIPNQLSSGVLSSSTFGLDSDITMSRTPGNVPAFRLQPLGPSGQAQNNSSNDSSLLRNPTFQQVQTQTATNTTAIATLQQQTFQGDWSASVSYSQSASVLYNDVLYTSLVNNNLGNVPSSSPSDWQTSGQETFLGAWVSTTSYTPANVVSVSSQLFIALQNSTNQNPTTTNGYWALLNPSAIAAWNSATNYVVNELVTFGNYIFTALVANINVTPPTPPATNSTWLMFGPSNLPLGVDSDGNLLFKNISQATGSTSNPTTTSGSYVTVPEMTVTITTHGNPILVIFTGSFGITTTSSTLLTTGEFGIFRDASQISGGPGYFITNGQLTSVAQTPVTGVNIPMSISFIDIPSAGSHTYTVEWAIFNGPGTLTGVGTARSLQVVELG